MQKKVVFFINVDWYFRLHWMGRAQKALELGYKVYVVTNFSSKTIKQELSDEGYCCKHIFLDRKSLNPLSNILTALQFFFLMLFIKPDLLHCVTMKPNVIGGSVARLLRLPVIFSVTGLGTIFAANNMRMLWARHAAIKLFRWITNVGRYRIIFENRDDRATFIKLKIGRPKYLLVIKGAGVDTDVFAFSSNFPSHPVILFAARLIADKGLDHLIEASRILKSRGRKFKLKVAGIFDPQNINAIDEKQIIAWHQEGLIEWLGQRDDMAMLLTQVSMVVLPTTYGEGIPRILIEAASAGRPIIGTDVAGCREIIFPGVNGLLVPPSNPPKLAEAIEKLLLDPSKQKQFGHNGRHLIEQKFSENIVIMETFFVYQQLMQTGYPEEGNGITP